VALSDLRIVSVRHHGRLDVDPSESDRATAPTLCGASGRAVSSTWCRSTRSAWKTCWSTRCSLKTPRVDAGGRQRVRLVVRRTSANGGTQLGTGPPGRKTGGFHILHPRRRPRVVAQPRKSEGLPTRASREAKAYSRAAVAERDGERPGPRRSSTTRCERGVGVRPVTAGCPRDGRQRSPSRLERSRPCQYQPLGVFAIGVGPVRLRVVPPRRRSLGTPAFISAIMCAATYTEKSL
jgi:hypothetical protein